MGGIFSRVSAKGIDGIGLTPPAEYGIARPTSASTEKLEQLIRANNHMNAVLFNNRRFHNHLPHVSLPTGSCCLDFMLIFILV